jgi:Flp pilus assembly protein TadG
MFSYCQKLFSRLGQETPTKASASRRGRRPVRRGVETLEMAVVLPMFLIITFGIIDWCWVFFVRQSMYEAARAGARSMAVQEMTSAEGQAVTENFLNATLSNFDFAITVQNSPSQPEIIVDISIPMQNVELSGVVGSYMTKNLESKVTMVREGL